MSCDKEQKTNPCPLDYNIHVRLKRDTIFFGNGLAQLLAIVDKTHSLNTAATEMGMAYSKAWKIIKKAEAHLDFPLTIRQIGGTSGGGSRLSPEGRKFLESYTAFNKDIENHMRDAFITHFEEQFPDLKKD